MVRPNIEAERWAVTPVLAGQLPGLVQRLCRLPEHEWVEFKENNDDPNEIGEYISALANSAALRRHNNAYLVWGVNDKTHAIVGTTVDPRSAKMGNEDLRNWLVRQLTPQVPHWFHECTVEGQRVVVLEISATINEPVKWKGAEYIRVGSYKKKLKDHVELERELWRNLDQSTFEQRTAAEGVVANDVLRLIDYPAYFDLHNLPLPAGKTGILSALAADNIIRRSDDGSWEISNLGALLFAKNLTAFSSLARKAPRVVVYAGKNRVKTVKEQGGVRGYASGFTGLIEYIVNSLPTNEVIGQALRRVEPMFPELAIRELVANALVHQDLSITGTGPMVEQFDDRLEITNPGTPLVDPERFVDMPPRSRNEKLAWQMRRCGICEERGTGWDKVALEIEVFQLPAPLIETLGGHTKVTLFAHRPLSEMDRAEKVRAVYLHACLKYVSSEYVSNTTIRERFGIEQRNSATASRLINDAVSANLIVPFDASASRSQRRYVPFWAVPDAADES
jgi:ATP-dependent DNA helicase RecG